MVELLVSVDPVQRSQRRASASGLQEPSPLRVMDGSSRGPGMLCGQVVGSENCAHEIRPSRAPRRDIAGAIRSAYRSGGQCTSTRRERRLSAWP